MANELNIVLPEAGLTLVCKLWNGTTQQGSSISMTENSSRTGHYYGDAPASIVDGTYVGIIETSGGVAMGVMNLVFIDNKLQSDIHETRIRDDEYAQAGSSTSIYLANGASSINNIYVGATIYIVSGPGAGQLRQITSYAGTSRKATVAAWYVIPDDTSVYRIIR